MSKEIQTKVTNEIPLTNEPTERKIIPFDEAVKNGIEAGKSFKLIRKVHTHEDKNKKVERKFYSYSVFIVLGANTRAFYHEISFLPDIGYVKSDEDSKRTSRNSSSYRLLNWLYAAGNGLKLEGRVRKIIDKEGKPTGAITFDYYAITVDDSGIMVEVKVVPATPGDDSYIRSAFAGFGKCRDYNDKDIETVIGLADALVSDVDEFDDFENE